MSPAVVRVSGVSHYFGQKESRRQVLFDNHLELDAGEIAILTGPSGSGKTTLLTLIGALRAVQEGDIEVLGRQLRGLGSADMVRTRREIGFVFQLHNLFESLTAIENVFMAMEMHGNGADRESRARAMLDRLGLADRLNYKPDRLSGGQRQRVSIARALVNQPKLVLADEPTAALDAESGQQVIGLLRELASERKTTVLIVTHDKRVLDAADRVINMVDGRVRSDVHVKETLRICDFLTKSKVFASLTPAALAEVAGRLRMEQFATGAEIIRQGDPGERFYVLHSGSVDVYHEGTEGRTRVTSLGVAEFFGEAALITGEPRNATVLARGNVELYSLSKDDFRAALDGSATFREQLLQVFAQRQ